MSQKLKEFFIESVMKDQNVPRHEAERLLQEELDGPSSTQTRDEEDWGVSIKGDHLDNTAKQRAATARTGYLYS